MNVCEKPTEMSKLSNIRYWKSNHWTSGFEYDTFTVKLKLGFGIKN